MNVDFMNDNYDCLGTRNSSGRRNLDLEGKKAGTEGWVFYKQRREHRALSLQIN